MKEKLQIWYYTLWAKWMEYTAVYYRVRAAFYRHFPKQLTPIQIQWAKEKGCSLDADDRAKAKNQLKCSHRKGGTIKRPNIDNGYDFAKAIVNALNHGTGNQYSVLKHQMMNGDIWVECLRCGRKWKPPIKADFKSDREFYKALEEYERAVEFETNNATSSSVQCAFRLNGSLDAGHEYVRRQLQYS